MGTLLLTLPPLLLLLLPCPTHQGWLPSKHPISQPDRQPESLLFPWEGLARVRVPGSKLEARRRSPNWMLRFKHRPRVSPKHRRRMIFVSPSYLIINTE